MPSERCPACKIWINGGFVAFAARLLSFLSRSESAGRLAAVADAARGLFQHAMDVGVLPINHDEQPDWDGCERATKIMSWIGQPVDIPAIDEMIEEIVAEMKAVTSGAAREHKHEHNDLLG